MPLVERFPIDVGPARRFCSKFYMFSIDMLTERWSRGACLKSAPALHSCLRTPAQLRGSENEVDLSGFVAPDNGKVLWVAFP